MVYKLIEQLNIEFVLACTEFEILATSYAEWRYHDNPEFYYMYLMGGEL